MIFVAGFLMLNMFSHCREYHCPDTLLSSLDYLLDDYQEQIDGTVLWISLCFYTFELLAFCMVWPAVCIPQ